MDYPIINNYRLLINNFFLNSKKYKQKDHFLLRMLIRLRDSPRVGEEDVLLQYRGCSK